MLNAIKCGLYAYILEYLETAAALAFNLILLLLYCDGVASMNIIKSRHLVHCYHANTISIALVQFL